MLNSKELKRTIVKRSLDYNIPLRYLCKETGMDYNLFMRSYINSLEANKFKATEGEFRHLLSILGIDIKYLFIIDKDVDMVKRSKELTDRYDWVHNNDASRSRFNKMNK